MKTAKNVLIEQRLKKEDQVEVPKDDLFFEQLHNKIMQAVEKTEIKSQTKWTKTWVFLEARSRKYRPAQDKVTKTAVVALVASISLGLGALSLGLFKQTRQMQVSVNQQKIINQIASAPSDWADLAAVSQSDSDLYAEILNQKIDQHGLDVAAAIKDM
jgi:hypothetical protein